MNATTPSLRASLEALVGTDAIETISKPFKKPDNDNRDPGMFSSFLPYLSWDEERELFGLNEGIGFCIELMPQSGADESTRELLKALYLNWHGGSSIGIHLFGTPHIANPLQRYVEHRIEDPDIGEQDGIGHDPRIGHSYMRPSYGFGGSCLPKEVRTLSSAGLDRGLPMHLTGAIAEANADHQRRFARCIADAVGGLAGKRIALLGLAFKADTDDVRSSPALRLAARLLDQGADLRAHDPAAGDNARRILPDLVVVPTPEEALQGADAAVIATEWPAYRDLDWAELRGSMRRPVIIDGRRLLPETKLRALGYVIQRVGDGVTEG